MNSTFNKKGFSLIELMVVISIIAALASLGVPSFIKFRIKAARVEMKHNMNAIHTLAHSYRAETGVFYEGNTINISEGLLATRFTYGMYYSSVFGPTAFCSTGNDLGFATSNCNKLRYRYTFWAQGGQSNPAPSDASMQTSFTITAESRQWETSGGYKVVYGNPAATICNPPPGYTIYFNDLWLMFESGHVQSPWNDSKWDAYKSCF